MLCDEDRLASLGVSPPHILPLTFAPAHPLAPSAPASSCASCRLLNLMEGCVLLKLQLKKQTLNQIYMHL